MNGSKHRPNNIVFGMDLRSMGISSDDLERLPGLSGTLCQQGKGVRGQKDAELGS